ncbi:MAG: M20/M25/M40 family metallo-hydrolase [Planctomycetes bacterium]|nr:M20/M25/M40 family metallo-hydrolase [Planctomycetota bacterium]
MTVRPAALVPLLLAAACSIAPDPGVAALVAAVEQERLEQHVRALCASPRPAGDAAATAATLAYIENHLAECGYTTTREPFTAVAMSWHRQQTATGSTTFVATGASGVRHNLIAEKGAGGEGEAVIELGAHFDTVAFGPGADDNASGVAALLEIARLVANVPTDKTIRFVFFAMEEEQLVGSREHVERMLRENRLPEGILSLDMVGYASSEPDSQESPIRIPLLLGPPYVGDFVLVAGNFGSGWLGNLFEGCVDAYVPELAYYSLNRMATWSSDAERVDAWNYWKNGVPAISLGDTAEFRNPHYHQPSDTPATLDYTFLRRNTQAVLATVLHWARTTR